MEKFLKLKGKFTQRWLAASDEYYSPIFSRLHYAQYNFLKKNPPMTDDVLHHLSCPDKYYRSTTEDNIAFHAVTYADALIAELNKKKD